MAKKRKTRRPSVKTVQRKGSQAVTALRPVLEIYSAASESRDLRDEIIKDMAGSVLRAIRVVIDRAIPRESVKPDEGTADK